MKAVFCTILLTWLWSKVFFFLENCALIVLSTTSIYLRATVKASQFMLLSRITYAAIRNTLTQTHVESNNRFSICSLFLVGYMNLALLLHI